MKIVFTPDWFLGKDVLIEGFSFLILLAFFILCWRYYKLSKKKSFVYLGVGFLLIALAQLATILTKLILYYDTTFTQQIGQMIVTYRVFNSVDIFYHIGFFLERLLTLLGLFIIYWLPLKRKYSGAILLVLYFIIISALVSQSMYFIFHITTFILLVLIISNYYKVYKENKNTNTELLILAFSILAFGHLVYILSDHPNFFVVANIIELVSYIILLVLIIRILRFHNKTAYLKNHRLRDAKSIKINKTIKK